MIELIKKDKQVYGEFNNGEIVENKPIGFPHEKGGTKAYSNLFYWAYAEGNVNSTIGLHPHKGFEIISYVIKGSIKHYDTLINKWISLNEGDLQVIQSGSGISHAEAIDKDSAIFQIWFDPNLKKSILKEPVYADYPLDIFNVNNNKKVIIGNESPVKIDSEKIEIFELNLKENYNIKNKKDNILSIYILSGELILSDNLLVKHDFCKITDKKNIELKINSTCKIFCISTQKKISYKTYI